MSEFCPGCESKVRRHSEKTEWELLGSAWNGECSVHGSTFAIFKCDSCCSVATWSCDTNHYCLRCLSEAPFSKDYPCAGGVLCSLGLEHPINGAGILGEAHTAFVLGCGKCII